MSHPSNEEMYQQIGETFWEEHGRMPNDKELQSLFEDAESTYIDQSVDAYREAQAGL